MTVVSKNAQTFKIIIRICHIFLFVDMTCIQSACQPLYVVGFVFDYNKSLLHCSAYIPTFFKYLKKSRWYSRIDTKSWTMRFPMIVISDIANYFHAFRTDSAMPRLLKWWWFDTKKAPCSKPIDHRSSFWWFRYQTFWSSFFFCRKREISQNRVKVDKSIVWLWRWIYFVLANFNKKVNNSLIFFLSLTPEDHLVFIRF